MKEEALSRIKELKNAFDTLVEQTGKPLFYEIAKPLFDKHPEVEAIRWHQYVPAFNDGDACVFSIGEVELSFSEKAAPEEDESENGDGFYGGYASIVHENKSLSKALHAVAEDIEDLRDVAEKVFDTNAQITICRDGKIDVEDYDCGY